MDILYKKEPLYFRRQGRGKFFQQFLIETADGEPDYIAVISADASYMDGK